MSIFYSIPCGRWDFFAAMETGSPSCAPHCAVRRRAERHREHCLIYVPRPDRFRQRVRHGAYGRERRRIKANNNGRQKNEGMKTLAALANEDGGVAAE